MGKIEETEVGAQSPFFVGRRRYWVDLVQIDMGPREIADLVKK